MALEIAELGNPVLRQGAKPVTIFNEGFEENNWLSDTVADLMQAMNDRKGVGIAAPQLSISSQILIVASRPNIRYPDAPLIDPIVMINPKVLFQSLETNKGWEGCLSVPGIRGRVLRSNSVKVAFVDVAGRSHELELDGFPARIFLHEYDHLIGLTFLDRVESNNELVTEKEFIAMAAQADH